MSAQIVSYCIGIDPALAAKIEAKRERALKPCCMRCGRILTAKRDIATRVCRDRSACTTRAICSFRAPKGMALKFPRNYNGTLA